MQSPRFAHQTRSQALCVCVCAIDEITHLDNDSDHRSQVSASRFSDSYHNRNGTGRLPVVVIKRSGLVECLNGSQQTPQSRTAAPHAQSSHRRRQRAEEDTRTSTARVFVDSTTILYYGAQCSKATRRSHLIFRDTGRLPP